MQGMKTYIFVLTSTVYISVGSERQKYIKLQTVQLRIKHNWWSHDESEPLRRAHCSPSRCSSVRREKSGSCRPDLCGFLSSPDPKHHRRPSVWCWWNLNSYIQTQNKWQCLLYIKKTHCATFYVDFFSRPDDWKDKVKLTWGVFLVFWCTVRCPRQMESH